MKYTVITGASSGIGYATALHFASKDKALILIARREDRLEALKSEIQEKYPAVQVVVQVFDLAQTDQLEGFFVSLSSQYDLETWINNAGFGLFAAVKDQDLAVINQLVDVNVKAVLLLSTLFVKKYQKTQGTQLLNVSSGAGYNLYPNCVTYTASKFFVSSFTENLAHELRGAQAELAVKLVVPEATETEFINVAADRKDKVNYNQEFGRFTTSQEMADYIWQLYESDYVVGQVNDVTYDFFMHDGHYPYKGK